MQVYICIATVGEEVEITSVHETHEDAIVSLMEYFDEYEPRINTDDPDRVDTTTDGVYGEVISRELNGSSTNGF